MYVTSCKLNNSYTTYIVRDYGKKSTQYRTDCHAEHSSDWKCGTLVKHYFHGLGKIQNISDKQLTVRFNNSAVVSKKSNILVTFMFQNNPYEVESLRLC